VFDLIPLLPLKSFSATYKGFIERRIKPPSQHFLKPFPTAEGLSFVALTISLRLLGSPSHKTIRIKFLVLLGLGKINQVKEITVNINIISK
jgi:hypothetical protein